MESPRFDTPSRPGALPPETRTVGQLVAEAVRLYGRRFWVSLALGLTMAVFNQLAVSTSGGSQLLLAASLGAVLLSTAFAVASSLVANVRLDARTLGVAVVVGVLCFIPAPFLALLFIFPAVAWLALVGLSVPAAVIERTGVRQSFVRGFALSRVDYVHALGSLATLAITYFLSRTALLFLLRGQADTAVQVAAFLADLVIAPILFLGAAVLYVDQAARLEVRRAASQRSG